MSDVELRRAIYRHFAATGLAPVPEQVGATADDYRRLAGSHAVVLGADGRIDFANPFASGPTDYVVEADEVERFGICAWDGLGVMAALGRDGRLRVPSQELVLEVRSGALEPTAAVAHFLVPAAHWYDDLRHT